MQKLAVQFLEQGFHRVLFDAMPMPVFVVDEDVSILEYNAAAAQWVKQEKPAVLRRRGGDVLRCVNAVKGAEGCGRSAACLDCIMRKSVRAAFQGKPVIREPARMELLEHGKRTKVDVRVSAHPFSYEHRDFMLLMLEGLNDRGPRGA